MRSVHLIGAPGLTQLYATGLATHDYTCTRLEGVAASVAGLAQLHGLLARRQLADAGINLCLATDSLSTVRKNGKEKLELNLFEEMRQFAAADQTVPPFEILRMATVNGAKALGRAGQIGELSENALADLIAIPFAGKNADIYDAVLHHASTVSASMIDGKWAIAT